MGVNEDKLAMLKGIFEEQRVLTDDEMQAYKEMLQRKENDVGVKTEKKDQATLIAELISRVTSLEDDMEFVLKHIRILEVDRQIEVISPSWEEDNESIEEYTWEQNLRTLLTHIGVCDIGKERWFDQDDGLWYDRKEYDHITLREVIDRAMNFISELGE